MAFQKPKTKKAAVIGDGAIKSKSEGIEAAKDDGEEDEDIQMDVKPENEESPLKTEPPVINGAEEETPDSGSEGLPPTSMTARKRSSHARKEEEDQSDEDDDEPVKKRTKRSNPRGKPMSTKADPPVQTQEKPRKAKISSSKVQEKNIEPKTSTSDEKHPKKKEDARKPSGISKKANAVPIKEKPKLVKDELDNEGEAVDEENPKSDEEEDELEEDDDEDSHEAVAPEKILSVWKSSGKDPYPDWKPGEPVPYAALCTTFSLIEMTTKRLIIMAHCSLFLRQVLRLTPQDLLPTIQLMINKLAADYAGIELGIGESLIMKAIGESTGRSLQVIKADQAEIGDLGLVAAKSRSNQPTMFKPKPLTVKGVLDGLMGIATTSGDGSQGRKIAGIKKLLSAADAAHAGKGSKGIDITKDKGGPSESKFIIRFLEGKLRLGLAERTVLVSLAHAMVSHEVEKKSKKQPSSEKLAEGEAILKTVYRYGCRVSANFRY